MCDVSEYVSSDSMDMILNSCFSVLFEDINNREEQKRKTSHHLIGTTFGRRRRDSGGFWHGGV